MSSGSTKSNPQLDFVGARPGFSGGIILGHGSRRTWNGGDQTNPLGSRKRNHWDEHGYTSDAQRFYAGQGVIKALPNGASYAYSAPGSGFTAASAAAYLPPAGGSLWTSNDTITLQNRLKTKLIGSDFNPAVFCAEGLESLETIADVTRRISDAIKYASKGNFREAARSVTGNKRGGGGKGQTAANNWLQVQYGIRPLLGDVHSAAEMLAHLCSVPFTQTVRVSLSRQGSLTSNSSFSYQTGWGENRSVTTGSIKAKLREVNLIGLSGLLDPAQVAWEKIPYSFVCDWFIPIGNFLAARGVANNLTGTFVTSIVHRVRASNPTFGGSSYLVSGCDFHTERTTVNRTVSSSLSVPLPSVKPLDQWFPWQHAANGIALLTGPGRKAMDGWKNRGQSTD